MISRDFPTLEGMVPPNWKQIVKESQFKHINGFYDITKTWFQGVHDSLADKSFYDAGNVIGSKIYALTSHLLDSVQL